jgi:hypothetical protein
LLLELQQGSLKVSVHLRLLVGRLKVKRRKALLRKREVRQVPVELLLLRAEALLRRKQARRERVVAQLQH